MASTPSDIPGYASTHCDGAPGLEYFQDGHAFAWTGKPDDLIEVSPGAYGEPVKWVIPINPIVAAPFSVVADVRAPALLSQFRETCDQWLAWHDRRAREQAAGRPHRTAWNRALKTDVCEICLVPAADIPADVLNTYGNYLPAQAEDCVLARWAVELGR